MASRSGVMLGLPDEIVNFQDDISNGWITNKFGGVPNWMNKAPSVYPQCNLCGRQLPMVAQIYCPLDNSSYHRVLYIFGCVNVSCWNKKESWTVLRCQSALVKNDERKNARQEVENEDAWCDDADDWGVEESSEIANAITEINYLEEQTRDLNLNKTESPNNEPSLETDNNQTTEPILQAESYGCTQTTAPQIRNTLRFIPYYITVLEEANLISEAGELTRSEKRLLAQYTAREGLPDIEEMMDGTIGGDWAGEKYEMSVAKHGDKIFQKFKKQLSLCSNQCLRYSWDGEPLVMTSQGLGTIPSCGACGEKRVFELQLMPALVSLLRIDGEQHKTTSSHDNKAMNESSTLDNGQKDAGLYTDLSSECIEFGTVFVYTCSQECWSDGALYREEYVIAHSDPDQHRFKNAK